MDSTALRESFGDSAWLTVAEVAAASGMSAQAIHKAIATGRLRATRVTEGNRDLWRIASGDAWIFVAARKGLTDVSAPPESLTVFRGRLSDSEYNSLVETLKLLRAANEHQIAELAKGIQTLRGQLDRISVEVANLQNISLLVTRLLESLNAESVTTESVTAESVNGE